MPFRNQLILHQFFMSALGVKSFSELSPALRSALENDPRVEEVLFDCYHPQGAVPIGEARAYACAENVAAYQRWLGRQRSIEGFRLKPFQLVAAFLAELFLECAFFERESLLASLEDYRQRQFADLEFRPFDEEDLRKIAFWMATGSGKTLLLHINYRQILSRHSDWDNILLITPNAGLSRQHFRELRLSGLPARLYDGNPDHLVTAPNEVLVIDIYKLSPEKNGEGVSVDVRYFEGKNLVFIDEGHKGQQSVEQTWKSLRETLARKGMIVEYSATFGQVVAKNRFLREEYAKAIIFDYSYHHFYHDGYGKAFSAINLARQPRQDDLHEAILAGAAWKFYAQLQHFQAHSEECRRYNVSKPLWAFVGSRVSGAKLDSDVLKVILFLRKILARPEHFATALKRLQQAQPDIGKSISLPAAEEDFFSDLSRTLFNGDGALEIYQLKGAPGELGLKCAGSSGYFGVVSIGDVPALCKLLQEAGITVHTDHFSSSLFDQLDRNDTTLNVLIGSKKFIEGWNSWRVSSMVLMNMGIGEGPQIIQLFGRGIRLKGSGFSLQREAAPPEWLADLQTLFIFGLNADYMNAFLNAIKAEGVSGLREPSPHRRMAALPLGSRKPASRPVRQQVMRLEYIPALAKKVRVDIRPPFHRVASDTGPETPGRYGASTATLPLAFIDREALWLDLLEFKGQKKWNGLLLDQNVIETFLQDRHYRIITPENGFAVRSLADIASAQQIALQLCKRYLEQFYKHCCNGNSG